MCAEGLVKGIRREVLDSEDKDYLDAMYTLRRISKANYIRQLRRLNRRCQLSCAKTSTGGKANEH